MDYFKEFVSALGGLEEPVVTRYRLGLLVWRLLAGHPEAAGMPGYRKISPRRELESLVGQAEDLGFLRPHPDFPDHAYLTLGRKDAPPAEIACTIDPFCYVSHLSAMEYHGLTDRQPSRIFLTSPDPVRWKAEAEHRMSTDLEADRKAYQEAGLPLLVHTALERIERRDVHRSHSKHWGSYTNIRGRSLRVSSIGRTFLDMLRTPDLCGGMRHVVQAYEEHAAVRLKLITNEIERHGSGIEKVRAGYILEERMRLVFPELEAWKRCAQRGGSRKLDPQGDYRPEWSETWSISLNL